MAEISELSQIQLYKLDDTNEKDPPVRLDTYGQISSKPLIRAATVISLKFGVPAARSTSINRSGKDVGSL